MKEPTLADLHAEQVEIRRLLASILGTLRARKAAPAKRARKVADNLATLADHYQPADTDVAMVRRALAGRRR